MCHRQITNLMSTAFKADFLGGLGSKLQFFLRTSVAALKDTEEVLAEMTQLEEQLDVRCASPWGLRTADIAPFASQAP